MIDFAANKVLTSAQDKARAGKRLTAAEIKELRIEADRLQGLALELGCPKPARDPRVAKALHDPR